MQGVLGVTSGRRVDAQAQPRLVQAAQEFEAQMMKELTRPVTRLNDEDESSQSDAALSEFAGEALARALSQGGGFGIAERAISSLSRIGMNHILSPESETAKDLTTNP